MADTYDYFLVSDVQVSDFDDWSVGEIQYVIDKLEGVVSQSSVPSSRAVAVLGRIKQGDLSTLQEARAGKREIRVITPFNLEQFMRNHFYFPSRYVEGKGVKTKVIVEFADENNKVIFEEIAGIMQLPSNLRLEGVDMPKIVSNPLFARMAAFLSSFVRVDNSNTEAKGTCRSSVTFLSFKQCGMRTELTDSSINTILGHVFFKGYPICNGLELAHHFMLRLAQMKPTDAVFFIQLVLTRLCPSIFDTQKLGITAISAVKPMFKDCFVPYPPALVSLIVQEYAVKYRIDMDMDSPFLPQRLSRGIPLVVGTIKNVTLDAILEYIPKARVARGEDLENSSAFTSDYVFGGFHDKRYILAEILAHIVRIVRNNYQVIVVVAKKSVLDIVCSISKITPHVIFYVVGPAMTDKNKGRFPNVKTLNVLHSCSGGLVIDMGLPELVSKGSRDSADVLLADYKDSVANRLSYYRTLNAKEVILAARQYMPLKDFFSYSYFPHSLSGFYSTFDWKECKTDVLLELKPITVNWALKVDMATKEAVPGAYEFYELSYLINKRRTFYALTLSGVDGLMAFTNVISVVDDTLSAVASADGKDAKVAPKLLERKQYLTNFYREYSGEKDIIELESPGQLSLLGDVGESTSDEQLVQDDVVQGLVGVKLLPQNTNGPAPNINTNTVVPPLQPLPRLQAPAPIAPINRAPVTAPPIRQPMPLAPRAPQVQDQYDGEEMIGFGTDS